MTTTPRAVRREMLARAGDSLGIVAPLTSVTVTTDVASSWATGAQYLSEYFQRNFLVRSEAATVADWLRSCSAFAGSTGTWTHDGTNYSDTTATSETLEVWRYDPRMVMQAMNTTLGRLKRIDRETIAGATGAYEYSLVDLSWITEPQDIVQVAVNRNPVLTRNRGMEKWSSASASDDTVQADWWTTSGSAATFARSTTNVLRGAYTLAITRAGTNALAVQTVPLLYNGVDANSLRGQTITAVLCGVTSVASQARIRILENGSVVASSSFHTGGGGYEELSVSWAVSSTAISLAIRISVEVDGTFYADDAYAFFGSSVTDAVRRGKYDETPITKDFDQTKQTLRVDGLSNGSQVVVYSRRGYPQFDTARLIAGSCDGATMDAPLVPLALGTIGRLYEMLAQRRDEAEERKAHYRAMADEWNQRFEAEAINHTFKSNEKTGAIPTPRFLAPAAVRYG